MAVTEEEVEALLAEPAESAPGRYTAEDVTALLDDAEPSPQPGEDSFKLYRPGGIEGKEAHLKAIFDVALSGDLNRQAGVLELKRALRARLGVDVPSDVLEQKYDEFQRTWYRSRFDAEAWRLANPELAKLVLERPDIGTVVLRDPELSIAAQAFNRMLDWMGDFEADGPDIPFPDDAWWRGGHGLTPEQREAANERARREWEQRRAAREEARIQSRAELRVQDRVTEFVERGSLKLGPFSIPARVAVPAFRFEEAKRQMDLSKKYWALMNLRARGADTYELEKEILDLEAAAIRRDFKESALEQVASDAAETAASLVSIFEDATVGGLASGAVAGLVALAATKSPQVAGRVALQYGTYGGKAGAAFGTMRLEAGSAYEALSKATTDAGTPLTNEEATGGAMLYGLIATGAELVSVRSAIRATGPLGKAVLAGGSKAALQEAMQELVMDRGAREILARAGKAWLKSGGTEAATEMLQTAAEDLITYLTRSYSAGEFQEGRVIDVNEVLIAGGKALQGQLALGVGGLAVNVGTQGLAKDAQHFAQKQVDVLVQLAEGDSPAVRADPEAVAKAIEEMSARGGQRVSHVEVDAGEFVRYFQSKKQNPEEAAAEFLGEEGPQQLKEALATGGRLNVPVDVFLTKWKELGKALRPHLTTRSDFATPAEMEAERATEAQIRELAEKFEREGLEPQSPAEASFMQAMERQLAATGQMSRRDARTALQLLRAVIRTAPQRFGAGKTAEQLFQDFAIAIGTGEAVAISDPDATVDAEPGSIGLMRRAFETDLRPPPEAAEPAEPAATAPQAPADVAQADARGQMSLLPPEGTSPAEEMRAEEPAVPPGPARVAREPSAPSSPSTTPAVRAPGVQRVPSVPIREQQVRALTLDRNTGLLNARGFSALRRDPSRPFLAEFDLEGKKLLNDVHGHESVDGALRVMARALEASGITDGAAMGGSIRAWVRDQAHAEEIARAMEDAVNEGQPEDQRLRVTAGVTEGVDSLEETFEALGEAHKKQKADLRRDGLLGDRALPIAFAPDRTVPEGFDPKTPEGKALMQRAGAALKPLADRLKQAPTPDRFSVEFQPTGITEDVREFAEEMEADWFETVARDETGLLTDDGFALARQVAPKKFVVSADMRGLADLNEAFGREGANEIIRRFKLLLIRQGGAQFDIAHPHGDEFLAQGDDERALKRFFFKARRVARRQLFIRELPGGGAIIQEGIHFAHGIGKTFDEADRVALPATKAEQGDVPGPREVSRDELVRLLKERRDRGDPDVIRVGRGAGSDVGRGRRGVRPAAGQEVDPETLAEVREIIGRMQPKNREIATAFLEYVQDPESHSKPLINERMERWFAEFGIVDPLDPPQVDARTGQLVFGGPRLRRTSRKKGPRGRMPAELLKARLARVMDPEEFSSLGYDVFKQTESPDADAADARGYTAFVEKGLLKIARIVLNKNADASTFLHESAHVFLEMLAQLADRQDAPQQVKDDFARVLKWAGVSDWKGLSKEEKTRVHEMWARGFEAYLYEGKAPSARLAGVFQRLKTWMQRVYRSIRELDVELNDDIRGVFDRLLATDQEIEAMRRHMGISETLFRTPEDMSKALGRPVSPEEWLAYQQEYQEAHAHAARALELRVLKDRLREAESWWQEETRRQEEIARAEYEELPARNAHNFLWGRGITGAAERDVIYLDRQKVESIVGKQNARRFPLRKTGGTDPGEVAPLLGYATGEEMLRAVLQLPDKETWAKERAQHAMREKFPEFLAEKEQLREEVAKGLHGDFTVKWLQRELKALGSRANLEQVRRAAKRIADERTVQRLDAGGVLQQERAAANRAMAAAARGDYQQAASAKLQQLVNMLLFRELTQAREDREAFLDLAAELAKPTAQARLGKAAPIYRDGVALILEGLGLKPRSMSRTEPLPSLGQVVSAMEADGTTVMFDAAKVTELLAKGVNWQRLKVAEMRAVMDALKNIRAAARARAEVLVGEKRQQKEDVVAQLVAEAKLVMRDKGPATTREAETLLERIRRVASGVDGWLLRIETMVDFLSGGNIDSIWHRAIIEPLQKAKAMEADLLSEVVRPIIEAFDKVPPAVRARFMEPVDGKKLFPNHRADLTPPRRRFELLMLALNAGNEGNLQRLCDGRNISEVEVQRALELLTKEEMDWVQSIWDAHEIPVKLPGETEAKSLKQRAFDLEERDSGLRPQEVQPLQVVTSKGRWRGGYFPVVYHSEVEAVGKKQEAQQLAELLDPSFVRPGTPHGHLKARAVKYEGAISLSPGVIYSHLSRAAHDIAYREALKSVGSLILSPEVQDVLRSRLGAEKAKLFLPWLRDIGTMRAGMDWSGLNAVIQWIRAHMAPALLGWRPSVAIGDMGNLGVAALDLNPRIYADALAEFAKGPKEAIRMVLSKSGEMRQRRNQLVREFQSAVKTLTDKGILNRGAMRWYRRNAFIFMETSDRYTSTPAWLAAYRQALAEGASEENAIREADKFVRDRFPSHNAVDMAHILRDKGFWGAITTFGSYLNVLYNRQRHIIQPFLDAEGWRQSTGAILVAIPKLFALWTVANVAPALLMGQGPEEKESWLSWWWRRTAMAPFENFHSELGGAVGSLLLGKRPNARGSPISGYLEQVGGAAISAASGKAEALKTAKSIVSAVGLSLGVPVTPINNALDAFFSDNEDAEDIVSDIIYGERRTQNPITAVEQAVE